MFYQPDPLKNGQGRCGVYLWRPLLCRLFGFAAQKDKYGQPQLVTCSTMKSLCSYEYEQALENMHQGKLAAPLMQDYAMRLFNIDPHWGKEQLPINQAIKIALEKVGLLNEKEKNQRRQINTKRFFLVCCCCFYGDWRGFVFHGNPDGFAFGD